MIGSVARPHAWASPAARSAARPAWTSKLAAAQLPLVALAVTFILICSRPLQGDIFWMLSYGRVLFSTGQLPTSDPLTFAPHVAGYIDAQWLGQLIYMLPYTLMGLEGIVVFNALAATFAIGLVIHMAWRRSGSGRAAAFTTAVFVAMALAATTPRAQTLAYVPFAITYWLLLRGTVGMRWLLSLAVIEAAWTNIHGSFFLGPLLTALVLFGTLTQSLRWPLDKQQLLGLLSQLRDHRVRFLIAAGFIQAAATLATPFGIGVYRYALDVSSHPIIRNWISEWQPVRIDDAWGPLVFLTVGVATVLLAHRRRWAATDIALVGAFALMALMARRNIGWWMLVGPPIVSTYLVHARVPWLGATGSATRSSGISPKYLALGVAVAVMMALPWVRERAGSPLIEPGYPAGAVQYLMSQPQTTLPNGARVMPDHFWATYLDYNLFPRYKMMIDPAVEAHPAEVWQDYTALEIGHASWEELLDKYDVDALLLSNENQRGLIMAIERGDHWRRVYTDEVSSVYVRAAS